MPSDYVVFAWNLEQSQEQQTVRHGGLGSHTRGDVEIQMVLRDSPLERLKEVVPEERALLRVGRGFWGTCPQTGSGG